MVAAMKRLADLQQSPVSMLATILTSIW